MNNSTKLLASKYLVKQAYANYLTMGGNTYSPDPVIRRLATHNLGDNTSNLMRDSTPMVPKASPAMGAAGVAKRIPQQAASKNDMNALFKKYMGTAFDPNSRLDKAKMKYLQGLSDKGVTMNAANIYDKGQGYGKW